MNYLWNTAILCEQIFNANTCHLGLFNLKLVFNSFYFSIEKHHTDWYLYLLHLYKKNYFVNITNY